MLCVCRYKMTERGFRVISGPAPRERCSSSRLSSRAV